MKAFRAGLLAAALALAASAGVAQAPESDPEAAPAPPPPSEAPDEPEGFDREAADDDVFIPSDEIQADEEVTFPVDI